MERSKRTKFGVGKLVYKAVTSSPRGDDAGTVGSTNTDAVVFSVGMSWGSSWKWLELMDSGDGDTRVASTRGTALGSTGMKWISVRWLSA